MHGHTDDLLLWPASRARQHQRAIFEPLREQSLDSRDRIGSHANRPRNCAFEADRQSCNVHFVFSWLLVVPLEGWSAPAASMNRSRAFSLLRTPREVRTPPYLTRASATISKSFVLKYIRTQ